MDLFDKLAFFNVRYKDREGQQPKRYELWDVRDQFKESPIKLDNNYLYEDENVDRWNSGADPNQRDGQPKGIDPYEGEVQKTLDNDVDFLDEDVISSFNKKEYIIDQVKKALTGG